jgi:hypothetical protein
MGDLQALADWMDEVGHLLQPVVITPNRELIAGGRRCAAWPLARISGFGQLPIPVRVVDIDGIAAGKIAEYAENVGRKQFALSEQVTLWREIEPALKEAARARQRHQGDARPGEAGRLRDVMKRVTGTSGRTLEKAIKIVEAAEKDPARYGPLIAFMDKHGADGALQQLKITEAADRIMTGRPAPEPQPKDNIDGRPHLICQEINRLLPDYFAPSQADVQKAQLHHEFQINIWRGKVISECKCGISFAVPYADGKRCVQETLHLIVAHFRRVIDLEDNIT